MKELEQARKNPFAPGLLDGLVAIVTGGATGIGRACARELLELGASVAICGRRADKVDEGVRLLGAHGDVMGVACDIREPERVAAFVGSVLERHRRIDILINNAGGQFMAPAVDLSPRGFDAVVRNNLHGTFYITREVATRAMIPQRRGSIVNVLLNHGRGFPRMAHSAAARAGVENLTRTLAVEWACHDVRVNAVAPGVVRSPALEQYGPRFIEASIRRTPQKRAGTVEEIAHAMVYLASPASAFMTGATLHIDGGASHWGDTWPIADRDPAT
ncbi:MAG TPA: SDR family oxidoreductase [Kofleriaceae bacterium]|nr:SDR family oxidoreductase [Kofleriaceae bacterium]